MSIFGLIGTVGGVDIGFEVLQSRIIGTDEQMVRRGDWVVHSCPMLLPVCIGRESRSARRYSLFRRHRCRQDVEEHR